MTEISVRALTEEDWQDYRSVRLAALRESPEAFVATVEEEEAFDESRWRERMNRSERMVAEIDGKAVGVVSIGRAREEGADAEHVGELFGLWVAPQFRGSGVATKLVEAGANQARRHGSTHLIYWVGTENGRAVAFASGMGFRPTDYRRPMGVHSEADGEEEIAMVLSLHQDIGAMMRP
jgi:ribosomal protein S18 acetylase RimI-like enzyme